MSDTHHCSEQGQDAEVEVLRQRIAELERSTAELERVRVLLERRENAERFFSEKLQRLVALANDLFTADTVDELCRQAVQAGREELGFDRVGIWFKTEDPCEIAGTFGVDGSGEIIDERHLRTRIDSTSPEGRVLLSHEPFVVAGNAPMVDASGEQIGEASQMFAAVWDGTDVIGHVSADNLLRNHPLASHQADLLRLFGTVLGYLTTRKRVELEREYLIEQLKDALGKIKTLSGLLPICCRCKKIRDDKGYWNKIDVYVQEHSDVDFSHSICPECAEELYPDLSAQAAAFRGEEPESPADTGEENLDR